MSDIKYINGKYYDFGCKNESFLLTAAELKALGIKNYYFMLRIDNPRIADIDPFKPNITKTEIQLILQECKHNIWYFARTCVRLRTGAGIVPLAIHRGLAAAIWCFDRSQDFCLNEPRQTYKTTGTIASCVQYVFQIEPNHQMHFFGKENDNTKRNLGDLKSDIELLPEWMQFRKYLDNEGKLKKARGSTEILENSLLHNKLEIHPKPTSLAHAQGLGRGGSGSILYFDEIEHTPFFGEILSNSAPLFKTASENARKIGNHCCRILTTTPGNLDTKTGRDALPIIESMIPWTEQIYDMTDEEIIEYKNAFKEQYHENDKEKKHTREVIDVFYMEYQYYQVRRDWKWVQEQYALSGDKSAIKREILLQRLRGSTDSPISPEDIEYLISNMKHAEHDIVILHKWLFKIYSHGVSNRDIYGNPYLLDPEIPYLVGIDPASGGGGDNFAITIVNPYNLQIAAEFKNPYISGPDAVKMLIALIQDYIPKGVLIPEKNSMGVYLIQMLAESSVRDNLYWSEASADKQLEETTEDNEDDRKLREVSKQWKKYGTYLTAKVRKAMIELLLQHVNMCKQILCTEYLVNDLCKLVRTSTGRIEADKGEHDDSLFSYLHTIYVYYYGDNLALFGINKTDHPLFGPIETEDKIVEEDEGDPEHPDYDQVVINAIKRENTKEQELVDHLSFVQPHSALIRQANGYNTYDGTIEMNASFFDAINGTDYEDEY